jgi:hypothetical protein
MSRATWEMLDKVAEKIGVALGKSVYIDRGGASVPTRLRINGHAVPGVGGTKQKCYDALQVFWEGIEQLTLSAKEGKASKVKA